MVTALSVLLASNWPAEPFGLWVETHMLICDQFLIELWLCIVAANLPKFFNFSCVRESACTSTRTSALCACLLLVCHWSKPAGSKVSHLYSSTLDCCLGIKSLSSTPFYPQVRSVQGWLWIESSSLVTSWLWLYKTEVHPLAAPQALPSSLSWMTTTMTLLLSKASQAKTLSYRWNHKTRNADE